MAANDNDQPAPAKTNRYLALGDSYTIGESVSAADRFPVRLTAELRKAGYQMDDVEIIAQTGWTTGELMSGIGNVRPTGPYDLVTLLIGVNNQYRGLDTAQYRDEFRQLLQQAIGFTGGIDDRVIVLSIPDYSVTPFAANRDTAKIAREIDAFNGINLAETRKTGAYYFDITGISRDAKRDPALLAEDGLHPSGKMYARWVEVMLPAAKNILEQKSKTK